MDGPIVMCWVPRMGLGSRQSAQPAACSAGGWWTGGLGQDQQGQVLGVGINHRSLLLSSLTPRGPHTCQRWPGLNKLPWEARVTGSRRQLPLLPRNVVPSPTACRAGSRRPQGQCPSWAPSHGLTGWEV